MHKVSTQVSAPDLKVLLANRVHPFNQSVRGQPISEALIKQTLADYDGELPDDALRGTPHPPLALGEQPGIAQKRPERASDVMAQVQKLCQAGDYPLSQVNMVCVPDAVGVTHEAAVLRSTLCDAAARWLNKQPDGHWRLQTALSIEGLLREVEARGDARKAQLQPQAGLSVRNFPEIDPDPMVAIGCKDKTSGMGQTATPYGHQHRKINNFRDIVDGLSLRLGRHRSMDAKFLGNH